VLGVITLNGYVVSIGDDLLMRMAKRMMRVNSDIKLLLKYCMHFYETSFDEILDTLKSSVGKKHSTKPTSDHSLCHMSAKSRSKKSTLPDEYKSNVFEKLYNEVQCSVMQRILLKNRKMKL
jgi:hypothetical protein